MRVRRHTSLITLVALLCVFRVEVARADVYGQIKGTVSDPTGALVPDVSVTATNVATGVSLKVMSRQDGTYAFLQLAVGDYLVKAEKSGFKVYTATKIHLDLNTVYVEDIRLAVGSVSEIVEVEASAIQVETSSSQLGTVVDANQIVNMPLIGRSFVSLQELQPGVMGGSDRLGAIGSGEYDFATNGGESTFNVFLIDGTDTNDLPLNTTTFLPSADALTEFRMVSATMNPEYARSSGAVISTLIKSGTNSFHGDAFDFYRDTFLNAKDPFTNTRERFHQNDFGGTIGGPILKNHTFAFFSYEGIRQSEPQPGNQTVSTPVLSQAQRAGTFGPSVASSNPSPFPLWGDPCPPPGPQCPAGTPYSTLFASGNIPTQDFSSFSTALVGKYVPLPNQPVGNNFVWNGHRTASENQYIVRIDETINAKDSLWGTWFQESFPRTLTVPFVGSTLPGFGEVDKEHFKFITTAWTHIINDHMLNELRGGYNRFNFDAVEPLNGGLPSSFGFANIIPQDAKGAAFPVIDVRGLFRLGFSEDGPQPRIDQVYQAADNFSFTHGNHTLKVGFDMRRWETFNPFLTTNSGQITFRKFGTYSTGNVGANFLLGIPTNYIQASGSLYDGRGQLYYSYVQDQYRIRSDLTLTYGLGWSIDTPFNNIAFNGHGQVAFRPGQQSVVFPNAPVGVVYQGDPGVEAGGSTHWKQFGPRVGFAYSPGWGGRLTGGPGKTSIRGGFGIYYDRSETEQADQVVGMPPFAITSELGVVSSGSPPLQNINPSFTNPFKDIATGVTVATPFPFGGPSSTVPFTAANGNLPVWGGCCASLDAKFRDPIVYNFNLNIERQLTSNTILSLGYVGSVAHHLTLGLPYNLAIGLGGFAGNPIPIFHYDQSVYGPIDTILSEGNSHYHSLQASVNKKLSHGLQFIASYTYSHSIDDTSGFENSTFGTFGGEFGGFSSIRASNPYCFPSCDIASSIFDARHRFVIGYFYQIPGLRGNAFVSRLTRGWTIAGITTFQTGFPLDVIDSGSPSGGCNGNGDFSCWEGPNQVGPIHYLNPRTTGKWFDTSAFAVVPCELAAAGCPGSNVLPGSVAAYGDAPRNVLRGPGLNNWDFQLYKDTQITESTRVETRIEFYNIFNHIQYDPNGVGTDIGSPAAFGTVSAALPQRRIQLAAKLYF